MRKTQQDRHAGGDPSRMYENNEKAVLSQIETVVISLTPPRPIV